MIQLISPYCQPKKCTPANQGFYKQNFTVPDGESEIVLTSYQSQNPNTFMVFDNGVLLTQVNSTPQNVTEYQVGEGFLYLYFDYTGERFITIVNS